MLISFFRYLKGYVRIRLSGYSPERFLNLCKARHIIIWDLESCETSYEMNLSIRDFRKLRPLCRKARARVLITERHGLPFFLYRHRDRKMFPVGILLCVLFLYTMSLFIWNIHIEGNQAESTDVILDYLASEQILHGMPKSHADCKEIQSMLRIRFPDITWVSAEIRGTRLLIRIRENRDVEAAEPEKTEDTPRDLVASRPGIITSVLVRKGVAQVKPGDSVDTGTLLVSGAVEIRNDSGEVTDIRYTRADADVWARTAYVYQDSFPLSHEEKHFTGVCRYGLSIQLGNKRFSWEPKAPGPDFTRLETEYQLRITENFYLPLSFRKIRLEAYELYTDHYRPSQARTLAQANLNEFLENLIQKGVQIVENDVTIDIGRNSCASSGTIVVLEKLGIPKNLTEGATILE